MMIEQQNGTAAVLPAAAPTGATIAEKTGRHETPQPLLVRLEELARLLNVSSRTAKRLAAIPVVPVIRLGRSVRFRRVDIDKWIAAGCPMTPAKGQRRFR